MGLLKLPFLTKQRERKKVPDIRGERSIIHTQRNHVEDKGNREQKIHVKIPDKTRKAWRWKLSKGVKMQQQYRKKEGEERKWKGLHSYLTGYTVFLWHYFLCVKQT